ncbi:MAG TPA: cytosine deaminase [Alphaproteobacteria bacterium]|nr:cytosine deaminase [Alphaproteobacteria bacterium]
MRGPSPLPALKIPARGGYHLLDLRIPQCVTTLDREPDGEGCVRADITIGADGQIESVHPRGDVNFRYPVVQAMGRQVWPAFFDIHAHLDKTATWTRAPNPDGTFDGAIAASREARRTPWGEDDIYARMRAAALDAYRFGTLGIRTHIDSSLSRGPSGWRAFERLRRDLAGKMKIQGVTLFVGTEILKNANALVALCKRYKAALGPVFHPSVGMDGEIRKVFEVAEAHALDLDIHVDETGQPNADALRVIADLVSQRTFRQRIICGHACSLSLWPKDAAQSTINKLSAAGVGIVTLPATNLYLQGRTPGETPQWRGITRIHEMRSAGIDVAIAGDNRRDAFYPFGDYDMLDVFRDAVRIAHLDQPMAGWVDAVTRIPATLMGYDNCGRIAAGTEATMIAFPVSTAAEVLAFRGENRQLIERGRLRRGQAELR